MPSSSLGSSMMTSATSAGCIRVSTSLSSCHFRSWASLATSAPTGAPIIVMRSPRGNRRVGGRLVPDGFLQLRLRRRQPGDRHAVGRAGDVVEPRAGLPALLDPDLDKLPYAGGVERDEGILLEQAVLDVVVQELARIVAAQAEAHLREVVGAEGEELGLARDVVRGQRPARDLDHRPDLELDLLCRGGRCAASPP